MKLHTLTALFLSTAALSGTYAQPNVHHRHSHPEELVARIAELQVAAKRQASGSSSLPAATSKPASTSTGPAATTPGAVTMSGTGSTTTATGPPPTPVVPVPAQGANGAPPLSSITSGMPTGTPLPVSPTYAPGATPPIPGAPPLPSAFVFNSADWPTQDKIPDPSSPQVQKWMQELNGFNIPTWSPTVDGTCANDPTSVSQASDRGWWTCGHYTRDTDITACPTQFDWGVSFDDGPSPWTQQLLNYLGPHNITSTFFVVGSRVVQFPNVLIEEYMAGHEISVHTWSHHPLTAMTNEQIVAELGWTRLAIQTVLGVTPTTMRAPYGDIDDRVRAISLAMGLVPILWTSTPSSGPFDTNDWRVAGGVLDPVTQFNTFQAILSNASVIPTGFIVLEHDLYQVTVELAVGYTLDAALSHNPPIHLKSIGRCSNIPEENLYAETNKNKTFPYTNHTVVTSSNSNSSSGSSSSAGSSKQGSNSAMDRRVSVSWLVAGLIGGGLAMVHSLF